MRAIRALYADLDYKPGALTPETAVKVIDDLSTMLGVDPVAVVASGGGRQPYWRLERSDDTDWTDENSLQHAAATVLLRRFGRLVRKVAETHGGTVDSVYDLSRILRVPGTVNTKYDKPNGRPVTVEFPDGKPVSVARLAEILDEHGIGELSGDSERLGKQVAPPGDWKWSQRTCRYVTGMVAGWDADTPEARHSWLMSQAIRAAAAHRAGCIAEADHGKAVEVLATRFAALVGRGTPRPGGGYGVQPGEISDALSWGVAKAATFGQARALKELGGHDHLDLVEPVEPEEEVTCPPNFIWLETSEWGVPGCFNPVTGDFLAREDVPEYEAATVEEEAFWNARPELTHIRTYAQAQMASPWAVLANVLARVVCCVPPAVVLPAIIYGRASLNLTVALVAASGGGKGGSTRVAEAAVRLKTFEDRPFDTHTLGTGHAIPHGYGHRPPKSKAVVRHADSVLFIVEEIDHLVALNAQTGSTTLAELRRVSMGEKLGHLFVDKTKRIEIEAHTYRGAIVVSVQPGRAGPG